MNKNRKSNEKASTIIAQGAEAIIRKEGNKVIKERVSKGYRIPQLDATLRKRRTRIEARNLAKISELLVPTPQLIAVDEEAATIEMAHIPGTRLSEILEKEDFVALAKTLGRYIARLHQHHIIHGDLTTSNFILAPDKQLFCIDLGLSFHSTKQEDKAVDLHLLKEALQSKHHTIAERCFQEALDAYRNEYAKVASNEGAEILERLEKVELRGRNKMKKGS